jgi:broad specificity phosphatase PhoE
MSIVLIRHGETPLNAARVIQPAETPLSERGRAQAMAVARRLAGQGGDPASGAGTVPALAPAAILSSDMPRAFETATEIAAATGLELRATESLHERNFGELRGRAYDELGFDPLATGDAPPGGESVAEFEARVARAFEEILALRAECAGDLIVVTHGLVIRTVLERHARLPQGLGVPASLANASVTVLAAVAPHDALLVNCTVHLQGAARDAGKGLSGF